jgi:hypothetical protein
MLQALAGSFVSILNGLELSWRGWGPLFNEDEGAVDGARWSISSGELYLGAMLF